VLVLALVALAGLVIIVQSLQVGISPMPSSARVRQALVPQLPETLAGELHELGAGWGGLALALARRCPQATVLAWEISLVPVVVLSLRARASGLHNLQPRWGDFMKADLRRAQAVVCYLFTGGMERLAPKLHTELPEGALILSNTFALRGWAPEEVTQVADLYRTRVYRYRVKRP
jgi:hypothetical protein